MIQKTPFIITKSLTNLGYSAKTYFAYFGKNIINNTDNTLFMIRYTLVTNNKNDKYYEPLELIKKYKNKRLYKEGFSIKFETLMKALELMKYL